MLLLLFFLIPSGSLSYAFPNSNTAEAYKCQFDSSCVKSLKDKFLNKNHPQSIYQVCQSSYQRIKNCCENLSACDSAYALNDGLSKIKSQLSSCDSAVLLTGLTQLQNEICRLGAKNCKIECENQLYDFLDRFRRCFNINQNTKIENLLKKAEANNSECYNLMKDIAGRYKTRRGLKLRDNLPAEDFVECKNIRPNALGLQRKASGMCQNITQQNHIEEKKQSEEEKTPAQAHEEQADDQQERIENKPEEVLESWKRGSKKAPSSLSSTDIQPDIKKVKEMQRNRERRRQSERNELIKNLGLSSKDVSFQPKPFMAPAPLNPDKPIKGLVLSDSEMEEERGLFKKGLYKLNEGVKKGFDKVKEFIPFMDSKKEMREKMSQLCESHKKEIHLVDQVVYQSVKAPQIERQDEEDKTPFDNYELIIDKPAGMVVRVKKPTRIRKKGLQVDGLDFDPEKLIEKFVFSIFLKIDGKVHEDTLCSTLLDKGNIDYKPLNDIPESLQMLLVNSQCYFEWSDFKDGSVYKFVSLPTDLGQPLTQGKKNVEVFVELKLKEDLEAQSVCQASTKFTVNMIEPTKFTVFLVGMDGDQCLKKDEKGVTIEGYEKTTWEAIKNYLHSEELTKDFYRMFPVAMKRERVYNNSPEIKAFTAKNEVLLLKGSCEKDDFLSLDSLSLSNLAFLDNIFAFAVVPEKYFSYHKIDPKPVGRAVIYFPTRYIAIPFFKDYYFAHKIKKVVGFLQAGWEEQGVFLHEMGHALGQMKEHYIDPDLPDYYCKQFTLKGKLPGTHNSSKPIGVLCPYYRIKGGVVRNHKFPPIQGRGTELWILLNNQESIMQSAYKTVKNYNLYQKWIDRETYQKALGTIENNFIVPRDFLERIKAEQQPQEPRIIEIKKTVEQKSACRLNKRPAIKISGIYKKNSEKRLTHFSVQARKIENKGDPFPLNQVSIRRKREEADHILIQLKRHGIIEEEIVFPIEKVYLRTFYENKSTKKEELDTVPIFADFFPSCDAPLKDDTYTLSIKEVSIENGVKKERILKKSVPVRWKIDV